jgi:membrane protease subunit HflK
MEQVMTRSTKVVVDQKGGNNLLYLPLDKLQQMVSQPYTSTPELLSPPASSAGSAAPVARGTLDRERGERP